jgi:uncharacterized membrane protein
MNGIMDLLSNEAMILLVGAMPVAEIRGAIPLGVSLGMSPIHAALLGLAGSMIPVPFLLLFLRPVFRKLRKSQYWRRLIDWLTQRTLRKTKNIRKYSALGLMFFVAIPLPSTGVWTGSVAASLLNIPFKVAFLAIFTGNCIAALIIMTLSHMAINF